MEDNFSIRLLHWAAMRLHGILEAADGIVFWRENKGKIPKQGGEGRTGAQAYPWSLQFLHVTDISHYGHTRKANN